MPPTLEMPKFTNFDNGGPCPFCMNEVGAAIKTDKRGRPYFICASCLTRAFFHSSKAYEMFSWCVSNGRTLGILKQQFDAAQKAQAPVGATV
jgi:hypothetical protein